MQTSFDSSAVNYDEEFTFSATGILQRNRVKYFLQKIILKISPQKTSIKILELNCGTGEDAIWLASKGHKVFATDVSSKMIEVAKCKVDSNIVSNQLQFIQCGFSNIAYLKNEAPFDLVFSNFGGLNCIDETNLKKLFNDANNLLAPNGIFVAVIMPQKCLWEQFYYLLKLNFEKAFRRKNRSGIEVQLTNGVQHTWYYNASEFVQLASIEFELITTKPIGLFIPPSYLESFFKNKKTILNLLNGMEKLFGFSSLSSYADHSFIALRKK